MVVGIIEESIDMIMSSGIDHILQVHMDANMSTRFLGALSSEGREVED